MTIYLLILLGVGSIRLWFQAKAFSPLVLREIMSAFLFSL